MFFNEQNLNVLDENQDFSLNLFDLVEEAELDSLNEEGNTLVEEEMVFMYESAIEYLEITNEGMFNEALAIQSGDNDLVLAEETKVWDKIKDFFKKIWNWVKNHWNKLISWIKSFGKNGEKWMQTHIDDFNKGIKVGNQAEIAKNIRVSNYILGDGNKVIDLSKSKELKEAGTIAAQILEDYQKGVKFDKKANSERVKKATAALAEKLSSEKTIFADTNPKNIITTFISCNNFQANAGNSLVSMLQKIAQSGVQMNNKKVDESATEALKTACTELLNVFKSLNKAYQDASNGLLKYYRGVCADANKTK